MTTSERLDSLRLNGGKVLKTTKRMGYFGYLLSDEDKAELTKLIDEQVLAGRIDENKRWLNKSKRSDIPPLPNEGTPAIIFYSEFASRITELNTNPTKKQ